MDRHAEKLASASRAVYYRVNMKVEAAAGFLLILVCGTVLLSQNNPAPVSDVTIAMSAGATDYCKGQNIHNEQQPDDITLLLRLKLLYQNHRSQTLLVPLGFNFTVRVTTAGQSEPISLRQGGGGASGLDVKTLTAASRPTEGFMSLAAGKDASSKIPDYSVLKFKDSVDDTDFVRIPVVDRSSGIDLRGKSVQIVLTRDYRSALPADLVPKLNDKWKEYGLVWAGVAESETVTFQIPRDPLMRDCRTPPPNVRPQ